MVEEHEGRALLDLHALEFAQIFDVHLRRKGHPSQMLSIFMAVLMGSAGQVPDSHPSRRVPEGSRTARTPSTSVISDDAVCSFNHSAFQCQRLSPTPSKSTCRRHRYDIRKGRGHRALLIHVQSDYLHGLVCAFDRQGRSRKPRVLGHFDHLRQEHVKVVSGIQSSLQGFR